MNKTNRNLIIEQLDRKFQKLSVLNASMIPPKGWIYSIRTALNMSLTQLAKKLNKSVSTVREIEQREENNSITLKKLMEVAEAMDLNFVYGFIPKEGSLANKIEKKAEETAKNIVSRTSHMMKLEDQENSEERLHKAVTERAEELRRELPGHLWD
jgi:predicted DNA-binding mobile mystery protein A